MFGIDISLKELRRLFKILKARLTYRQAEALSKLQALYVCLNASKSEEAMYRGVLKLIHHYLPPRAKGGWIAVEHYDEKTGQLLPRAIYPAFKDPDMHARVSESLTYDLRDPECRGVIATCARKALGADWRKHPLAMYPDPVVVDDVRKLPAGDYRLIDPHTRSEAAVAMFWGSRLVAVLNLESRSKNAFRNMQPLLNGMVRKLELFYGLYRASTVGCAHAMEQLMRLDTDLGGDLRHVLKDVCRIVGMAVAPAAKVSYLNVWDGTSFSRELRAWSIQGTSLCVRPYLQQLELRPNGLSRRVLDTRIPQFDLRKKANSGIDEHVLCDETLYYMLDVPDYRGRSNGKRSCSVLPLMSQGTPIGVLWLLFERGRKKKAAAAAEQTYLSCVANVAGHIIGAAIRNALEKTTSPTQTYKPMGLFMF